MTENEYIYAQALTNLRACEYLLHDTLPAGALTKGNITALLIRITGIREQMHADLTLDHGDEA